MRQFELFPQTSSESNPAVKASKNAGKTDQLQSPLIPRTNPNLKADPSDADLVAMAVAGNKSALNRLLSRHRKKLINFFTRRHRDCHLAEDLAQETLIKVTRSLHGFRGDSKFSTWLFRVASNTATNHYVMMKRRPPLTDIDATDSLARSTGTRLTNVSTPEEALVSEQSAEMIMQALVNLPPALRESVELRELDGLTYRQIANQTQCPIGTVRSRIFRAREMIASRLRA